MRYTIEVWKRLVVRPLLAALPNLNIAVSLWATLFGDGCVLLYIRTFTPCQLHQYSAIPVSI